MRTDTKHKFWFRVRQIAVICFLLFISAINSFAETYSSVEDVAGRVASINSSVGNVVIDLTFDNTSASGTVDTMWNIDGNTFASFTISGKPSVTTIWQPSTTGGRLLNLDHYPNLINIRNLNLSSFNFSATDPQGVTARNGGAINLANELNTAFANTSKKVTFDKVTLSENSIDITITQDVDFDISGGGIYVGGGISSTLTNYGEIVTLSDSDFKNNSLVLKDTFYIPSNRQYKTVTGGGLAIVDYNTVKYNKGTVSGNSVSANIYGHVGGGGIYLFGLGSGSTPATMSTLSAMDFANNSSTMLNGGNGNAYGGAILAEQQYAGDNNSTLLVPKSTITINTTTFNGNSATNNGTGKALGGAVAFVGDVDGIFEYDIFSGNFANSANGNAGGGAVAIDSNYVGSMPLSTADVNNIKSQVTKFNNSTFSNNTVNAKALGQGGAIFSNQRIETARTDFTGNVANGENAAGGAIAITKAADDNNIAANYESAGYSLIQGGEFKDNKAVASSGNARGGAIYTTKNIEIVSGGGFGDVLFEGNLASSGVANGAYGNSIFADANVTFNAAVGSMIEDFDGHYVVGNVTKTGGGILSLSGNTQHLASNYYIKAGVLRSGFTSDGESSFRAVANLDNSGGAGSVLFDDGAVWELDLSNVDMAKLMTGVRFADGDITGAARALRLGSTIIDVDLVDGQIKFARVLETANLSDIFASTAYLHKWNTINRATSSRINQLLYPNNAAFDGYFTGDKSRTKYRGQSHTALPNGGLVMLPPNNQIPAGAGQTGQIYADGATCVEPFLFGNNAWVNYVGRKSGLESSYASYNGESIDVVSNGLQIGVDFISGNGRVFGFMFGYEQVGGSVLLDRVDSDDFYFGVYGARLLPFGYDIRGTFGYGHQWHRVLRYDWALSREFEVSADGDTLELNVEFGRRFQTSYNSSLRPYAALDYLKNWVGAADEGSEGFRYNNLALNQLFLRIGGDVQWYFGQLYFGAGAAYSQQLLDDYASATVAQGPVSTSLRTSRYGNSVFTFNVGASYSLGGFRQCSVYANYVGEIFVDGKGKAINTVQTGIQWKF
ncbi:MAG: autotransporter outer membrane beta-barrel domain-containing protein [Planctomycetaceae bacterium]|jgi:hypothetical protein|nr:autotransporter outer membrane beta-barrel domain-containing protein [Planctomycetaceae bacterium]